jgi:spermidine synthase
MERERVPTGTFSLLVHVFFLFSGASALIYEIVWTRQLVILIGATTPAVSLILAIYMGGLALGAWMFGRVADRSRHLLRWYGTLELSIGLFALAQPWLLAMTGRCYLSLLQGAAPPGMAMFALRALLTALLFLVPTTLMGGTFPVLVRYVASGDPRFGRVFGTLYASNLLGAILGSALTGFLLIRALGVRGTLHWAVALNLSVGLLALALAGNRGVAGAPAPEPAARPGTPPGPGLRRALWCAVAGSGVLTMSYEVAWSRMLVFSFSSTIHAFTVILVVFLLGLALGGHVFTRLEHRRPALP